MKRVLAILLFVPFVMALAPPCHAAGKGEVAVSLVDVPSELQERSVLITLGSGPNDTDAVLVVLNGLNQYGQKDFLEHLCSFSVKAKGASAKADAPLCVSCAFCKLTAYLPLLFRRGIDSVFVSLQTLQV